MKMITRICLAALCAFLAPFSSWAQPKVKDLIRQAPSYASCNYYIYPDSITKPLTPSPEGKKPFLSPITDVMARVISVAAAVTIYLIL